MCQREAFVWAKKAIDLNEQNYVAALVLGRIYLYEGEYDIGEHYLRSALRLNPNDTDTLIQLASCFVFFRPPRRSRDAVSQGPSIESVEGPQLLPCRLSYRL